MINTRPLVALAAKALAKLRRARSFTAQQAHVGRAVQAARAVQAEAALEHRVVVITGSSKGIGLVLARAFLARGARVVINGRGDTALAAALQALQAGPERLRAVQADVSTEAGADHLLAATLQAFGAVDVLINNAGVPGALPGPVWQVSDGQWRGAIDTNLNGSFFCAKACIAWMLEAARPGRIICVSSAAVLQPVPGMVAYATSKVALEGFVRNLAADLHGTGIVATAVQMEQTQSDINQQHASWADFQLLPPAEVHVPVFLHAATADGAALHGRALASWRFNQKPTQETLLAGPLALAFKLPSRPRPAASAGEGVFLDRAENQLGVSPAVREALARAVAEGALHLYPDLDYTELRQQLARRLQLAPEQFSFGNGSSELVERALRVFIRPTEAVICSNPTWFVFELFAGKLGVTLQKVPMQRSADGSFHHDLDAVAKAIRPHTRLIYLVHPSNPTGAPLLHDDFVRWLERVPRHIAVIVDEAYIEFADRDRADLLRTPELVRHSDRLVIGLRTFSKLYGLAGLRVGYAFGSAPAIRLLETLELTFAMSTLSAHAARLALDDQAHADRVHENNVAEKRRIGAFLRERGLDFAPSQSNMVLFECPTVDPLRYFSALRQRDVHIAESAYFDRYVLWPVGRPDQNDRIMQCIRELT